jgi:gas vesicle protein
MSRALKWKLIAGFILVFVAGGLTGAYVAASHAHSLLFGPYHGAVADRMRHRLRYQLRLTDEQMTKISPIIDKTATQLETIRAETGQRVRATFAEAHREIATELTPEQQEKLKAMDERRRHWLHHGRGQKESESPTPAPSASPSP